MSTTAATINLAPVNSLDILRQAESELTMVVQYGFLGTMNQLDAEHIVTAHRLIGLVIKAQKEGAL